MYNPITSRIDLLAYIKRRLGEASHVIELTPEDFDDCIDDTLQLFLERAYDGAEEFYEEFQLTKDQFSYTLPDNIVSVFRMLSGSAGFWVPIMNNQFYVNNFGYCGSIGEGVADYAIMQAYMNSVDTLTKADIMFTFNSTTKELRVHSVPQDMKVLLHTCRYAGETEERFNYIYGHRFVKDYAVALATYRWGIGLIKYDGDLYDGNLKIDKEGILNEGKELIEKALLMFEDEYTGIIGPQYI